MNQKSEFIEELYRDEAVCFIADRHNVSPSQLVDCFLEGTYVGGKADIALESNEIEILKGLSRIAD